MANKRKRDAEIKPADLKVSPAGYSYVLSTTQPKHVRNKASGTGQVKMTVFVTSATTERNKLIHFDRPNLAASCFGAIAQMLKDEQKNTDKESGGGGGAKRKAKPRKQDGGGMAEEIVEARGTSRSGRERKSRQHNA